MLNCERRPGRGGAGGVVRPAGSQNLAGITGASCGRLPVLAVMAAAVEHAAEGRGALPSAYEFVSNSVVLKPYGVLGQQMNVQHHLITVGSDLASLPVPSPSNCLTM